LSYLEQAYLVSNRFPDRAFAEEYLCLLVEGGEFDKAWRVYESLPSDFAQGDRLRIIVGAAALALDKDDFMERLFETEFAVIREGEVAIIELWYRYNAKKLAAARGGELTPEIVEEAKTRFPPPAHLDFRMIGS